jgi:hypothetical protein
MRLEVRRANLDDDVRDLFEQYGEQVVAMAWRSVPIKALAFGHTRLHPRTP